MGVQINLRDVRSGSSLTSVSSFNNTLIEESFDKALDRTSSTNNAMQVDLDMGDNRLINVQESGGLAANAVNRGEVDQLIADAIEAIDVTDLLDSPITIGAVLGLEAILNSKVNTKQVGTPNGVAGLDSDGKVPSTQLPSSSNSYTEYADVSSFPVTGEAGKLYLAIDTNKLYRWTGTAYGVILGGAGSSILGIVAGDAISIDETDPEYPIINLNPTLNGGIWSA